METFPSHPAISRKCLMSAENKNLWLTLMNRFAFVSSPSVVCRLVSEPKGTMSFSLSKQLRKWALLEERTKSPCQFECEKFIDNDLSDKFAIFECKDNISLCSKECVFVCIHYRISKGEWSESERREGRGNDNRSTSAAMPFLDWIIYR